MTRFYMKRVVLFVSLGFFWSSYAPANQRFDECDSSTSTSSSQTQYRGFFRSAGTISLQFLVGTMGGSAGLILTKIHPVVGGVGWIVGSSFGVYSIGDQGTGRGDYWWTAAAGTALVLAFTPAMASNDIGGVMAVAGGMVGSLVAEIVAYHLTEGPPVPQTSLSMGFLDCKVSRGPGQTGRPGVKYSAIPCLVFSLHF
jgi:hypothetical protein